MARYERKFDRIFVGGNPVAASVGDEDCLVRDLCLGGMFVYSETPRELGQRYEVHLRFRGLDIHCEATVCHNRRDGFGVAFASTDGIEEPLQQIIGALKDLGAPTERRSDPRVAMNLKVTWVAADKQHEGILRNLSATGLYLESRTRPLAGVPVEVRIPKSVAQADEPNPELVSAKAEVVRETEDGFAVQFVRPPTAFNNAVADWVSSLRVAEKLRRAERAEPDDNAR